jgi:hypothetical protein
MATAKLIVAYPQPKPDDGEPILTWSSPGVTIPAQISCHLSKRPRGSSNPPDIAKKIRWGGIFFPHA